MISDALRHRLPVTFQLGAMAMVLSALVAVPIGVFSAIWQDSYLDYALRRLCPAQLRRRADRDPELLAGRLIAIRFDYLWDDPLVNLQILWVPTLIPGLSQLPGAAGRASAAPPRRHRR